MEIKISYIISGVTVIIMMFLISWGIKTFNQLGKLKNKVDEYNSDIDVALTKRFDLLTKQYNLVKLYCSHESKTLIETIHMRSGMSFAERSDAEQKMNELRKQIHVTMEAYPELKANENVMLLQKSCDNTEEHLQAARRLYNSGVTKYNNICITFPSSVVALLTGHKKLEFFKAEESKRQDVNFSNL